MELVLHFVMRMKNLTFLTLALFFAATVSAHAQPKSKPVTVTGYVAGAPQATEFNLRTNGEIWRVKSNASLISRVRGGDLVRVFGRPLGRLIHKANIRVLRPRASTTPEDYNARP